MRMRLRSLLWLVALAAFLLPSFVDPAVANHRMSDPVMSDCGRDMPPPPCPEKDTAKHAAGLCCPVMSGTVALLPPVAVDGPRNPHMAFVALAAPHLTGLSRHKDPPPPRV